MNMSGMCLTLFTVAVIGAFTMAVLIPLAMQRAVRRSRRSAAVSLAERFISLDGGQSRPAPAEPDTRPEERIPRRAPEAPADEESTNVL